MSLSLNFLILGEYLGQTKTKVREKLGQAKGSILFIDEAYELGKGMFGNEAMTTILEAMTSDEYKGTCLLLRKKCINFILIKDWSSSSPATSMKLIACSIEILD
jgi:hypothetical protein